MFPVADPMHGCLMVYKTLAPVGAFLFMHLWVENNSIELQALVATF